MKENIIEGIKEWRVVILIVLILLILLAVFAVVLNVGTETQRAACYKLAQRFNPPLEWRLNPWGSGDGCELFINGTWFPADMIFPALQ
jgi:hypothetical protein